MTLFEELSWRGFVHQTTHDDLGAALAREPFTFYCGFDPTADSLHIGSLLPLMGMAHLQRAGHHPLILVGGGTGLIGDPSFKAQERSLLTKEQVQLNALGIRRQLEHFLSFEGANAARMVNNADWLCELRLVDFLRDIGKHFSVNVMLSRESVRQRLEDRDHGISYTEFTYSLLQAYDFLHLCEQYDCRLQVGGSDQWGNIVAGMDLSRRMLNKETYALTFPLVTKSDGTKFGKTETGNVWLDPARTSPYKFYQFWINQADADVPRYLRYFTFLGRNEIEDLEKQIAEAPHLRAAQTRLAEEITRLVHGQEALDNAIKASKAMFGGDLADLDAATLLDVFSEVPSAQLSLSQCGDSTAADIMVACGFVPSKSEVKRHLQGGGLLWNGKRLTMDDFAAVVTANAENYLIDTGAGNRIAIVQKGKKNHFLLKFDA